MARSDNALLTAFLLAALLGIWTRCLLLNDGAVFMSAGWLGDAWHLYFDQFAGRAVSVLTLFGPAWAARAVLGLGPSAYMTVAHTLYFGVPLVLWLVMRTIERDRLFSRLYLAVVLVLMYFPSELIVGIGLWLIWLALMSDPARSTRGVALTTLLLGTVMAFTHPTLALMSLLYMVLGLVLAVLGRPVPPRNVLAAAALSALLLGAYFATSRWLPPTNPTITAALENGSDAYINPLSMLKTLALSPVLAALCFLLLVRGAGGLRLRQALLQPATLVVGVLGVCFAAAGTGPRTWIYARPVLPMCWCWRFFCAAGAGGMAAAAIDAVCRDLRRGRGLLQRRSLPLRPLRRSQPDPRRERRRGGARPLAVQATLTGHGTHPL